MHGVIIQQGVQNFQIISRREPVLRLSGIVIGHPDAADNKAQARLVQEDTGVVAVDWQTAVHEGDAFTLTMENLPAGGLYRLETQMLCSYANGGTFTQRGDMAHHIGVGDLFIVAGQSNATGYGQEPVYDPAELGLSVYRENGVWDLASHPLSDGTGSTHDGNLEDINPRHSPWLHCARLIKKQTGYPIGLIPASLGGSPLSRWDEAQDGDLYKIMLETARNAGSSYSGIIWYQGCSDAMLGTTDTYFDSFTRFVNTARRDLNDSNLPIFTVQVNRDVYPFDDLDYWSPPAPDMHDRWGKLREIQRQAAHKLPAVYIVPAHDLGMTDNVHNSAAANITLGQRMAYCILQNHFGYAIPGRAPDLTSAVRADDKTIDLSFTDVFSGLTARSSPAGSAAIQVRDGDGNVSLKQIAAWGNTVRITAARPIKGQAFVSAAAGYDYKGWPPHDTVTGMPLLAFHDIAVE